MCEICLQTPCAYRCPNAKLPKYKHRCAICGNQIFFGEEYIAETDYAHIDCLDRLSIKGLIDYLGVNVKIDAE